MSSPWFVDFADLNGDQIQDMVGVNGNSNANIQIYHGKADGTFELKTTLTGSGEYYAVFLENLNADNVPDIVAVSNISGILFLSSPSGYAPATLPAPGGYFNPNGTLFADFDNDGDLDLFIRNQLLINSNGNGAFTAQSFLGGNGGSVATDFNNDGFMDIVITNPGIGDIYFYPGKGDGTFQPPLTKTVTAHDVTAYDLNADGFVEILAQGYQEEIIIFHNDDTFSFSQTSTFQLGHNYYSVVRFFDIDHDGKDDFVTSNDNNIQYRPILPDGSFGDETTFTIGMGALRGVLVTDAIGEPFPDLIAMNGFGTTRIFCDKLNLTVDVADVSSMQGRPFPPFAVSYTGFVGSDDSSDLLQQSKASTTATPSSELGEYEITTSGGADETYEFFYKTGVLTITDVVGIPETTEAGPIEVFPNPAIDKIRVNSTQWTTLKIYDLTGKVMTTRDYSNEDISLQGCSAGLYVMQIQLKNGDTFQQRIRVR